MDFELSDDQQALQLAARHLLDDHASPARVREVLAGGEPYDRQLWEALEEQGWLAVEAPESAGGLGLGFVEVAVLAEQVGRCNAPAPFVPTVLARAALAPGSSAPPARAPAPASSAASSAPAGPAPAASSVASGSAAGWAAALAEGTAIGTVGWAPAGTSRVLVPYAPVADVVVVVVGDDVHVVDLAAGGRPPAEPAMDLTRCVGWIDLDRLPASRLADPEPPSPQPLSPEQASSEQASSEPPSPEPASSAPSPSGPASPGQRPAAGTAAARLLDRGAAAYSAEMLGGAARVLEMATGYAKERVQFGRPIGSFQAVKHRCADMLVDVEGMVSTAYYAAWCVSVDDPDRSVAASTAKVWCSDAARRVMASGLQVHGGIGFTWDHDLHLFLKRAQLDQVVFGDATFHRERLAGLLRARLDDGASVL